MDDKTSFDMLAIPVITDLTEYTVTAEVHLPETPDRRYLAFGEWGREPAILAIDRERAEHEAERLAKMKYGQDAYVIIRDVMS